MVVKRDMCIQTGFVRLELGLSRVSIHSFHVLSSWHVFGIKCIDHFNSLLLARFSIYFEDIHFHERQDGRQHEDAEEEGDHEHDEERGKEVNQDKLEGGEQQGQDTNLH